MGSTKESQAARSEAIREVIENHPEEFAAAMRKAYSDRGLGEWQPRLTAEQRRERDEKRAQEKAAEKIREMAARAGLDVHVAPLAEDEGEGDLPEGYDFVETDEARAARQAREDSEAQEFTSSIDVVKSVIRND